MRYQDLKFRTKQAISFGLILILMGGVNVLSIQEMTALNAELERISSNWLPRTVALADLNTNTSNLRLNQLQYATANNESAREQARLNMIDFIGRIAQNYDTYDQLKTEVAAQDLVSPNELALFSTFDNQWETYQDLSFLLLEHSDVGNRQAALTLLNGESQVVYRDLRETVNNLVEVNKADALVTARRAEQTFQSSRRIVRLVVGFTFVFSVLIAVVLVRVVTEPLGQLVEAVESVAGGNLDVQLQNNNKDEIGQLAQSFNDMTPALRKAQERIHREAMLIAEAAELRAQVTEAEAKAVKAENERKTYELEEARKLQLSMLPTNVPQLPDLEVAVYMQTATEVGGDYYDFYAAEDDSLTLAIGDATGHGLHAGTMVSATKSLFTALGPELEPVQFLRKANRALKLMGLRKMYMALTLARISNGRLVVASAGMPYAIVCRAHTGKLEDVILKGMPLGGFDSFPYQQADIPLHRGDLIVFMSDGIPERFNEQKEMFGEVRIKEALAESLHKEPEDVIAHLLHTVNTWANGNPQEDDETLVVLKVREVRNG